MVSNEIKVLQNGNQILQVSQSHFFWAVSNVSQSWIFFKLF